MTKKKMTKTEIVKAVSTVMTIMELAEDGSDKEKNMSNQLMSDADKLSAFYRAIK